MLSVYTPEEIRSIKQRVEGLRVEHRDLDDAIDGLLEKPYTDQLQLRRLKKRKLQLKDAIEKLESLLIPDLDA